MTIRVIIVIEWSTLTGYSLHSYTIIKSTKLQAAASVWLS